MLREETIRELKEKIKEINRDKEIDERLKKMINLLDDTRLKINDELDEIFSAVNLKKKKLNLED
ncbi:MAG: hypothetical protein ABIP51_20650 [Bacteroidia bacterium]